MRSSCKFRAHQELARGDGGKPVFEDEKDRYGRVELTEEACARFGWRDAKDLPHGVERHGQEGTQRAPQGDRLRAGSNAPKVAEILGKQG